MISFRALKRDLYYNSFICTLIRYITVKHRIKALIQLVALGMIPSVLARPEETEAGLSTYAPILALAVAGFLSTRFIKRSKPEVQTEN